MKFLDKLKKMPDENKKIFSGIVALFLTIIIMTLLFAFGPKKKDNVSDIKPIFQDEQIETLKQTVQKSLDDFNQVKNQLYATSTNVTISSTTSATSTSN